MEDVVLNPVSAYPFLILSEDRKQVKRGEKLQFYRNSPHRFDVWSCVTAKEGYAAGRHYWEVREGWGQREERREKQSSPLLRVVLCDGEGGYAAGRHYWEVREGWGQREERREKQSSPLLRVVLCDGEGGIRRREALLGGKEGEREGGEGRERGRKERGRHYWEVKKRGRVFVGENKDWKVGVVSESAQRKGLFDMSPPNGYYALWWSGGQLRALTTPLSPSVLKLFCIKHYSPLSLPPPSPLSLLPLPPPGEDPPEARQVGVFMDHDLGQVSFFNSKTGSEIYSFNKAPSPRLGPDPDPRPGPGPGLDPRAKTRLTNTLRTSEFNERMFPLLGTGDKEVPVVLMTQAHV
ncbi:hypothetical protein WMY93_034369 [Mugilogobius chulae]|uniref:B30.2/SPRY domain-containing protein n=1 Tax=Mugilogobius chulae TaxID=88201 RepID=A0AAW0MGU7_9GOBI